MADNLPPEMPAVPKAVPVPKKRWAFSLVWLIPIVAALVGLWAAFHYITSRGPTITISFQNAEGLEVGRTKVRYKNVDIGTVTGISIAKDRSHVIVKAKIEKHAEGLIVEDTRFWVVRPRVTLNSVSGLGTLLSGAYIGLDAGRSEVEGRHFDGLEVPPAITSDSPGRQFLLRAEHIGSLYIGAPVFFRRVSVGNVTNYTLDEDGRGVTLEIFINAPHDKLVTENSRFWHASGIDLSLAGSGVKINTESITSIIIGGIAFQEPPGAPPSGPVQSNASFKLFPDRTAAMERISNNVQTYLLYFSESLRGLAPGAPVDFHGIVVGEVKSISVEYDQTSKRFRFPVEINVFPERMQSRYRPAAPKMSEEEQNPQFLISRLVERGFRAQLKSANLLTGQLFVALDFFPNAPEAKINWDNKPVELPTVPGPLEDIQSTLGNIAKKLEKIPFDSIGKNADQSLKTLNSTLRSADKVIKQLDTEIVPEMKGTIEEARKAIGNVERTLASDAPLQQDLRDTLDEVGRAAASIRLLADYLDRHPEALIRGRRKGE